MAQRAFAACRRAVEDELDRHRTHDNGQEAEHTPAPNPGTAVARRTATAGLGDARVGAGFLVSCIDLERLLKFPDHRFGHHGRAASGGGAGHAWSIPR